MRMYPLFIKILQFAGIFLIGCYSTYAPLAMAADIKKPILTIQHWRTSQNVPVYFVRTTQLPMVDIQMIFTAGSAYDEQAWGIAKLTASALDAGTQAHTDDQIATIFDQAGAQFTADVNRDVAVIALRSLSDEKYFQPASKMLIELLSRAAFPAPALTRIQRQILSAIIHQQQDPSAVAANAFYQRLYGDHPYGHPVLGTADKVAAISQSQVQAFYQKYYVSSNAQLILVGNLQLSAAKKLAEALAGSLPKGQPAPALAMENQQPVNEFYQVKFPAQQTTLIIGQLGIDRKSAQYFPLMVGNFALGQMSLGSLLFTQVREQRGLVYGIRSSFLPLTYRGPFAITLQTRTAEKNQALQVTQQILQEFIQKGLSDSQLQLAKQNLINHFPLNLATNADIAEVLAQMVINQRPLNYLDTYRDNVSAVNMDQITNAFQQVLSPGKMLTVSVGE